MSKNRFWDYARIFHPKEVYERPINPIRPSKEKPKNSIMRKGSPKTINHGPEIPNLREERKKREIVKALESENLSIAYTRHQATDNFHLLYWNKNGKLMAVLRDGNQVPKEKYQELGPINYATPSLQTFKTLNLSAIQIDWLHEKVVTEKKYSKMSEIKSRRAA